MLAAEEVAISKAPAAALASDGEPAGEGRDELDMVGQPLAVDTKDAADRGGSQRAARPDMEVARPVREDHVEGQVEIGMVTQAATVERPVRRLTLSFVRRGEDDRTPCPRLATNPPNETR